MVFTSLLLISGHVYKGSWERDHNIDLDAGPVPSANIHQRAVRFFLLLNILPFLIAFIQHLYQDPYSEDLGAGTVDQISPIAIIEHDCVTLTRKKCYTPP